MKVAIFGGSGFIGYDFFRRAVRVPNLTLQLYSTSPQGLTNLKRHGVSITSIEMRQLPDLDLGDADVVVSFAHPFRVRDALGAEEQIHNFAHCVRKNHQQRPRRLIQLSSTAVYGQFKANHFFSECERPVPTGEQYSDQKILMEEIFSSMGIPTILLRPSFVYGPFGIDFTDLVLNGFAAGSVDFHNLDGKCQPVYVRDVSELIVRMIFDFEPGIFHATGPEVMTWLHYFRQHEIIVKGGSLVCRPEIRRNTDRPGFGELLKAAVLATLRLPEVREVIHPLVALFPRRIRSNMKAQVDVTRSDASLHRDRDANLSGFNVNEALRLRLKSKLATDYFAQDRLVSSAKTLQRYPGACDTRLERVLDEIARYFLFRFTDQICKSSDV